MKSFTPSPKQSHSKTPLLRKVMLGAALTAAVGIAGVSHVMKNTQRALKDTLAEQFEKEAPRGWKVGGVRQRMTEKEWRAYLDQQNREWDARMMESYGTSDPREISAIQHQQEADGRAAANMERYGTANQTKVDSIHARREDQRMQDPEFAALYRERARAKRAEAQAILSRSQLRAAINARLFSDMEEAEYEARRDGTETRSNLQNLQDTVERYEASRAAFMGNSGQ